MEGQLEERSGRWMKGSEWSTFWYSYQWKVYNGPAFSLHKNGEQKEKGEIINGEKSGLWSGWDEKGNLKYKGSYFEGNEDGEWKGYYANGKVKYEGEYKNGKQIEWKNAYFRKTRAFPGKNLYVVLKQFLQSKFMEVSFF